MSQSTWLITGASSGLGASLALQALAAGHKVIGASRDIRKATSALPNFAQKGGTWLEIDPGAKDASARFAQCGREHEIDVLVNNAGYAFVGGVEDTNEEEVRQQLDVNFYGPLRAVRAILPSMRARRSGSIVLISSGAGFIARPARSTYAASKFAIEAAHESLAAEIAPFNIKTLIVEPGAFRTPFASRIVTPVDHEHTGGVSEAYRGTVVETMVNATKGIKDLGPNVKGNPDKAAKAILNAVDGGHEYLRLPLGGDCVMALEGKIAALQRDLDLTMAVAMGTNVD